MFDSLSERIEKVVKDIKGYGKINEDNIKEIMRDIRLAMLEADVSYKVVKEFTNRVKEKALGEEVQNKINPGDLFVKIIRDELVELLGKGEEISLENNSVIMLVGLQGSGKTTTAGKLALHLRKKHKKKTLLVACDVYRPAAIQQLKQIGKEIEVEVYEEGQGNPVTISQNALEHAKNNDFDIVIIDTAGRLHIDENLMNELTAINEVANPKEIILNIDSMIGQDAINVIEGFTEQLNITGAILTKMDGDTKGGVALSLRYLTSVPIKFIGVSEKMDGLEKFYPERIADRIMGMGDIATMVEKAQSAISEEDAKKLTTKMNSGKFDLNDFLLQMKQIKNLGPLENVLKMIPGASKMGLKNVNVDPRMLGRIEAIVLSMNDEERGNPSILKASRKKRIAKGSGTTVEEVNRLLKQFEQMKQMMKQMKNGKMPF